MKIKVKIEIEFTQNNYRVSAGEKIFEYELRELNVCEKSDLCKNIRTEFEKILKKLTGG